MSAQFQNDEADNICLTLIEGSAKELQMLQGVIHEIWMFIEEIIYQFQEIN